MEKSPPYYLRRALGFLVKMKTPEIKAFARACGVKETTAWHYACKIVETWPTASEVVGGLVYPPLWKACTSVPLLGSLKEVMQSLEAGPFLGDSDWRCVDDRYAHLRLARLCLQVEGWVPN